MIHGFISSIPREYQFQHRPLGSGAADVLTETRLCLVHGMAHASMILLHEPYVATLDDDEPSLQQCVASANEILRSIFLILGASLSLSLSLILLFLSVCARTDSVTTRSQVRATRSRSSRRSSRTAGRAPGALSSARSASSRSRASRTASTSFAATSRRSSSCSRPTAPRSAVRPFLCCSASRTDLVADSFRPSLHLARRQHARHAQGSPREAGQLPPAPVPLVRQHEWPPPHVPRAALANAAPRSARHGVVGRRRELCERRQRRMAAKPKRRTRPERHRRVARRAALLRAVERLEQRVAAGLGPALGAERRRAQPRPRSGPGQRRRARRRGAPARVRRRRSGRAADAERVRRAAVRRRRRRSLPAGQGARRRDGLRDAEPGERLVRRSALGGARAAPLASVSEVLFVLVLHLSVCVALLIRHLCMPFLGRVERAPR